MGWGCGAQVGEGVEGWGCMFVGCMQRIFDGAFYRRYIKE